jgi:Septum formation
MNTTDTKVWVRALTVATIAAAGILLSGCSLLGQLSNVTGGDTSSDGGDDDVFQIKVGECFNDETPEGETVSSVQKVDCAEPHIWEAYKSIIIDEGDGTYPGEDVVTGQSETDCKAAFQEYVGIDYDSSTLYLSFYYPTEETWTQINDREILCIVTTTEDFTTKTTGSVKGSAK